MYGVFLVMMLFFVIFLIFFWSFAKGYSDISMLISNNLLSNETAISNINTFKLFIFSLVGSSVSVSLSEETV